MKAKGYKNKIVFCFFFLQNLFCRKRLKAILKNLARNNVKVSDDSTGGSLGLTVS